jgi:hypothetical protein
MQDIIKKELHNRFIYEEIALKPSDRKLPSESLLRNEAIKAFQAWASKDDKVSY